METFQEESIKWTTMWMEVERKSWTQKKKNTSGDHLVYRRRCGLSLVACGLRSYSGVYLGSIPIRGSGAVVVG